HLKELLVVLLIAAAVFAAGRPVWLRFMRSEDFILRRNVWFGLTLCAFLSPNFWIYALIAFAVLVWAGRKDSNPVGLFLIGYGIIPPLTFYIPGLGINQLFGLSQARILSLAVLLPVAIRLFRANKAETTRSMMWVDALLIAYTVLQLV